MPSDVAQPAGEDRFERDWMRSLLTTSLSALETELRESGRPVDWQLFAAFDLAADPRQRPGHAELAADCGLSTTQVANRLSRVRGRLRAIVLVTLRAITSSEEEAEQEAELLFGRSKP